jgi:hypothetical protein
MLATRRVLAKLRADRRPVDRRRRYAVIAVKAV